MIRAKGQSNPSPEFLFNQTIPSLLWPVFRVSALNIRAGWLSKLTKQSAASAWYGEMVKRAVFSDAGVATVSGAGFEITKGTMSQTAFTAAAHSATQTVVFTYPATAADITQNVADLTAVVVVNGVSADKFTQVNKIKSEYGDASRADGTTTVTMPAGTFATGDHILCYLGFVADQSQPNARTSSSSVHVDTVAVV